MLRWLCLCGSLFLECLLFSRKIVTCQCPGFPRSLPRAKYLWFSVFSMNLLYIKASNMTWASTASNRGSSDCFQCRFSMGRGCAKKYTHDCPAYSMVTFFTMNLKKIKKNHCSGIHSSVWVCLINMSTFAERLIYFPCSWSSSGDIQPQKRSFPVSYKCNYITLFRGVCLRSPVIGGTPPNPCVTSVQKGLSKPVPRHSDARKQTVNLTL